MPTNIHYSGYTQTAVSALTTELNSLATAAYSAASAAQDNTTNLDFWADFELNVTFGTNPTAGTSVDLYIVSSLDGTNYGDGGGAVAPPYTSYVGPFPVRAVTTAQRIELRGIQLPEGLWKAVVLNNGTGQAMAASGNTLLYRSYKSASG